MVDTVRTNAELLALLADNTSGDISPQDLRDMLVSLANSYQELNTSGWDDITTSMNSVKLGGISDPTFVAFQPGASGSLKAYKFAKGNEVFFVFHVPHTIKPSSLAYLHVHWTTNGVNTGVVGWDIEYTFIKGHDQSEFPAPATIVVSEAASGTAWRHMLTEDATGITLPEPDTLVVVRMERNNTALDTCSDNVFGLEVDLHYQVNRVTTKNRAPDFYS